ncbi:DUF1127 domain-containing protein [Mesobaculum littorinae]|uniref:DUF1127 domain-containing protein n=1 Tax=Mesobaculum littorinae TaxID=2486419 RepID=A0A438AII5_9RHOB|nr:DUF1127 domain-containing protein [Mesobaculum littorinae]RVV98492.1 DUF1127 domain-containing protein [Mesobaculum littorinae]
MAFIDTTRTPSDVRISSGALLRMTRRSVANLKAWNTSRQTRKMLSSLSDQALDDIGLSRKDIARVSGYR